VAPGVECAAAEAAEDSDLYCCTLLIAALETDGFRLEADAAWHRYQVPIRNTMPVVNCIPVW
jgi:hypothetical protein